jgi:hypothetical protein
MKQSEKSLDELIARKAVEFADQMKQAAAMADTPCDPNRPSSPWLTVPSVVSAPIAKARGANHYRAYTGAYTGGLNGAYWLRQMEGRGVKALYQNMGDVGKKQVEFVTSSLEPDFIYPLLRGRDIHRWQSKPSAFILIPFDRTNNCWIPESTLKKIAPKTYAFLLNFRKGLLERKTAIVRQQMQRGPFYAMVAVGSYTFAPWKVVYKRLSNAMQAAVIPGGHIPHEKAILIPVGSEEEAHYVAALLNSSPANLLMRGAAVRVQTIEYAPSDVAQLSIPIFDPRNALHKKLAKLSAECHSSIQSCESDVVAKIELRIDEKAGDLWGLSDSELKTVQAALHDMEGACDVAKGKTPKVQDGNIDGDD